MLDNEDRGLVATAYVRLVSYTSKQSASRRDKLEFPFRHDVLGTLSQGRFTDEDREIPSVGAYSFLFDCHRRLFAQNGSLILCADHRANHD
jgi:hypothetical protein